MAGVRILVVGDSHVRFWSGHNTLTDSRSVFKGVDLLCVGDVTADSLSDPHASGQAGSRIFALLEANKGLYGCIILSFGEIDCRSHILARAFIGNTTIEKEVREIVVKYKSFIDGLLRGGTPVLQWGPPPSGASESFDPDQPLVGTMEERNAVTRIFNQSLRELEIERPNFKLVTLFDSYVDQTLRSDVTCFFDSCHLSNKCLAQGEDALRKGLMSVNRVDLLSALERDAPLSALDQDSPIQTEVMIRNIADGISYRCSSVEFGTTSRPFRGQPSPGYKFHTKLEAHPWILMDFGAAFLITKIVVYNRSDACQDRARTIQIEASVNGIDFYILYPSQTSVFSGVWQNRPLIVENQSTKFYRYLRLSLRETNFFHLDFVEVYSPSFLKTTAATPLLHYGKKPKVSQPLFQDNGALRPLNILYFSCHEILEYDDLAIFTSRNHRVFSLGAFANPAAKTKFRNAIPSFFHPGDWEKFQASGGSVDSRIVTEEFAAQFDVAIVNHYPEWIEGNLNALNGIPVIYRSIGQSSKKSEDKLRALAHQINIIRYSSREVSLKDFLPSADVIYFGKFLTDRPVWRQGRDIVTFHNDYPGRNATCAPSLEDYTQLSYRLNMRLYGLHNQSLPFSGGLADPEQQARLYANAAAYFYVYSTPPSYTLSFIEALAAGVPIVAPSEKYLERRFETFDVDRYEIPELLSNDSRVLYDTIDEAHEKVSALIASPTMSSEISEQNFMMAQRRFNASRIAEQWEKTIARLINASYSF